MTTSFETVAGPVQGGLAGLCWTDGALLVAAPVEGVLYRCDVASGRMEVVRKYTNRTHGIGVDAAGNLYGCQENSRRVIQFCADGSAVVTATQLDGRIHNHPNNLCIDTLGRIWFSDPHSPIPSIGPPLYPPLTFAAVLRLERDPRREWTLKRMTFDTREPRAVEISPDEKTLYVAEGGLAHDMTRELRAYTIREDGTLGGYIVLQSYTQDARGPHRGVEGMCLDADGNIVACAGYRRGGPGPVVSVISPTGVVLESHLLPADMPMNCCFGGADLDTLYVTTADGHLLRSRLGARRGYVRFRKRPDT